MYGRCLSKIKLFQELLHIVKRILAMIPGEDSGKSDLYRDLVITMTIEKPPVLIVAKVLFIMLSRSSWNSLIGPNCKVSYLEREAERRGFP